MERRRSTRIETHEVADLYFENRFVKSCAVSSISPSGVFVAESLPAEFQRGTPVDLYFPIDRVLTEHKLLCLRGIIARRAGDGGAGIHIYSKRLPMVPPA